MWLLILEALAALCLLLFFVWWTMFSGRRPDARPDLPPEPGPEAPGVATERQPVASAVGRPDDHTLHAAAADAEAAPAATTPTDPDPPRS